MFVYGGSRLCLVYCLTCNLSLNVMVGSLHLYHLACQRLAVEATEVQFLAAAAVALAWKHWEDREGVQNPSQKLAQLVKALYLIFCHTAAWAEESGYAADAALQECANEWIVADEGMEFDAVREKLKVYEILILRAVHFHTRFPESVWNHILALLRRAAPEIDAAQYDAVYVCAVGVFCDYLRWPNYLNWQLRDVCAAVAFKAGLTMGVPLPNGAALLAFPDVPAILQDLRSTYEAAEAAERRAVKMCDDS